MVVKIGCLLLLACLAGANAQACVQDGKPLAPRMELAYNRPGGVGRNGVEHAGIILKVWNPVAEGRGGGCVKTMAIEVWDPSDQTGGTAPDRYAYAPLRWDVDSTSCNPCYFLYAPFQGATVKFSLRAYGMTPLDPFYGTTAEDFAKASKSEATTLTVTAAGTLPKNADEPDHPGTTSGSGGSGFIAFKNKRIGGDGTWQFEKTSGGCVGSHETAASGAPCKVCGGPTKFYAANNSHYMMGWQQQEGSDCATMSYNWGDSQYGPGNWNHVNKALGQPPLVHAPGWTAYLRSKRILTKCEGCFDESN